MARYLVLFIDDSKESQEAKALLHDERIEVKIWDVAKFNGVSGFKPPLLTTPEGTFESFDAIRSFVSSGTAVQYRIETRDE
jgi:hypothetical protein